MVETIARTYSEAFTPEYFVLLCTIAVLVYEVRSARDPELRDFGPRVGVVALGWAVAFAIYEGAPSLFGTVPSWGPDFTGSLGLGVGITLIWGVWRVQQWGRRVPEFSLLLVAATVPHLLVTPFWDVSSHVLYAAVPAGYLAFLDRRFAPALVVALGMVVARPLAGAHTWPESIGGLVLAGLVLAGFAYRNDRTREGRTRGTATDAERL
ncbi:hypothetical protein ACFQDG_07495 [Natronoarchaeum mannanilyticum]